MIQVHNLKKKFDDFQALNGVEMHVGKGDIYGLVGPNGAGKSTLIRHLTGAYKADEGEILIGGEPVFENRNIKQRMAYIPDELFYFMQADTMEMKRFYEGIYPQFDSAFCESDIPENAGIFPDDRCETHYQTAVERHAETGSVLACNLL